MPPEDPTLGLEHYQRALLDLLSQPLSPAEMLLRLQTGPEFRGYRHYTEPFELRMVEVAAALVKKWGRSDGIS